MVLEQRTNTLIVIIFVFKLWQITVAERLPCSQLLIDKYDLLSCSASKEHWAVLTDAQTFATTLESRRWNFGDCDEDVVIFYSLDDNVVS